jgi:hypothetical protein
MLEGLQAALLAIFSVVLRVAVNMVVCDVTIRTNEGGIVTLAGIAIVVIQAHLQAPPLMLSRSRFLRAPAIAAPLAQERDHRGQGVLDDARRLLTRGTHESSSRFRLLLRLTHRSVIFVAVACAGDHDVDVSATMGESGRLGALPPRAARVTALLSRPAATVVVLRLVRVCFALPAVITVAIHLFDGSRCRSPGVEPAGAADLSGVVEALARLALPQQHVVSVGCARDGAARERQRVPTAAVRTVELVAGCEHLGFHAAYSQPWT